MAAKARAALRWLLYFFVLVCAAALARWLTTSLPAEVRTTIVTGLIYAVGGALLLYSIFLIRKVLGEKL
jgi:hypothetical protein